MPHKPSTVIPNLSNSTKNSFNTSTGKIPNPEQQRGSVIGFLLLIIIIVGMLLLAMYLIKQDKIITNKFEGKRWNIPAKVYSQPLELYQGASLTTNNLDTWLEMLNYKSSSNYNSSGTYNKSSGQYVIHTRGFQYSANDVDPQQVIKIKIQDSKITSIQSTQPNDTGIVRVEPVTIGGIYPDNNEDRIVLPISEIPQPLIDALISTEDRGFYQHKGVSLKGIGRAIYNNLKGGSMQGGSTITQQLVKNFYLSSDRTLKRKANEAIMALLLELHYSKDEILQTYLNEINLGQNGNRSINGFGLAAQFYFNKPLKELRIDQQALLVGLAKGTSYYNPRRNPERALDRRNTVLANMLATGKIDQNTYEEAIANPLDVVPKPSVGKSRFPDFLDIVKRELQANYHHDDLKNEGLRVFSTLDPIAQFAADDAVQKELSLLRKKDSKTKSLQAALLSANPASGELVAAVGSGSEFTGFNRAVDAKRQVGSLLKPFIYMTALESGKYNLASSVNDSPVTLTLTDGTTWTPKNYDGIDHGYIPLTTALAKSYNQAAVNTGVEFGVDALINQIHLLGINEKISTYPSLFLGSVELSPMQMLGMYQVVAAGGFRTPIISIRTVVDDRGTILQRSGLDTKRSVPPDVNYLTNYALQEVVKNGTATSLKSLGSNLNLAGKTGTTNDYRDAWFAGYSGNYVSVVWVGRDDNKPIGLSGSSGALPVWKDFMGRLNLTPVELVQPDSVEWLWLENGTGKLSHESCEGARYLPVLSRSLPEEASDCALAIYQQEQSRRQMQWINDQRKALLEQSRQLDSAQVGMPSDNNDRSTSDNPNNDSQNGEGGPSNPTNSQHSGDTWYDKALEWF
ncbi:penicillin-binding protein 1B [Psychrobacter sp.]|uniref:penicillin-binding protein 1B n=1 Tax=Psychrobacter sp. TaxID=56811 RepID=UPI0025EC4611|nr:penicillin-binding protein 1B [Psychrobacter sp.]